MAKYHSSRIKDSLQTSKELCFSYLVYWQIFLSRLNTDMDTVISTILLLLLCACILMHCLRFLHARSRKNFPPGPSLIIITDSVERLKSEDLLFRHKLFKDNFRWHIIVDNCVDNCETVKYGGFEIMYAFIPINKGFSSFILYNTKPSKSILIAHSVKRKNI